MKSNEKKVIIVLLVIVILIIGVKLIINNKSKDNKHEESNISTTEEYTKVLSDNTKLNTSTKMQEKKIIDGLEIDNIQLTEKNNVSVLLGTVTNNTNEKKGDYPVNIIIYDKQGNEITTVGGYIGEIEPGESTQLNSSATFDYSNAYDFKVEKIK